MAHPDIMKALELVTKHAGRAHAEKVFSHLLGTPTPGKALDEDLKSEVLDHNMGNGSPTETPPVNPGSDMLLEETEGSPAEEAGESPGEEEKEQEGMRLGVASTKPRMMAPMHTAHEAIMSAEEMPRRKGGWPKGKSRKGK